MRSVFACALAALTASLTLIPKEASRIEQEFPHHVDIVIPPGGLGTRLDAMYDFHGQHDIKPQRGHGKHDADSAVIRWCFADASLAAAFASKFRT